MAISESGGAFNHGQLPSLDVAEATGQRFLRELGIPDIEAARSVAVDRLLEATSGSTSSIFAPLIDGNIVRAPNVELYRAGLFNDTPVLIGFNSDDRDDIPARPTSVAFEEQYQSLPPECGTLAKAVVAGYPHGTDAAASRAFKDLKRDAGLGWQTWTWAHAQARKGKGAVYLYYFDARSPKWPEGAPHDRTDVSTRRALLSGDFPTLHEAFHRASRRGIRRSREGHHRTARSTHTRGRPRAAAEFGRRTREKP